MFHLIYGSKTVMGCAAVLAAACLHVGCGKESRDMTSGMTSKHTEDAIRVVADLTLYPKGAIAFHERPIPADRLTLILKAVTPYVSLCNWKLLVIQEKDHRLGLLSSMQEAYGRLGKQQWANTMERWKAAPVILVFCAPRNINDFAGVPAGTMRPMTLIEMGFGIQSLTLTARAHEVETHWIASALLIEDTIRNLLEIPDGYDIVFFGVAGYPSEEIAQDYPEIEDVCFAETWGDRFVGKDH